MAEEERPVGEETTAEEENEVTRLVREQFSDAVLDISNAFSDETVLIRQDQSYAVLEFLRDNPSLAFNYLVDITAVDRLYLDEDARFVVVYHLYSYQHKRRFRVKTPVPESDCHVASVMPLWPAADWLEREIYDMFGITFDNHPNLCRILMPDDFESHPLRKDYPLHGKGERDSFRSRVGEK